MKNLKTTLLLFFLSCQFFGQVSDPKLQWKRNTHGISYEDEQATKGYRDPATGNIYVMYQGYYNYGITRFDNSGASVANFKQKSLGNNGSFGGDFKYIGNSELVTCGMKWPHPDVMKITSDGDSIWEYVDNSPGSLGGPAYFPNQALKSITKLANGSIVSGGTKNDTTYLISLTSNGTLNWKRKYMPANYDLGIVLGIQTDNFNTIYTCGTIRNSAGNFDAFVTAFNQNGNVIWERFIQGAAGANDSATKILTDNSGNVYVAGIIKDSSASNSSTFLVKYNASGGLQYLKKFHQTGQENASLGGMNFDPAGNVALVSNSYPDATHSTVFTQKYNTFGALQWTNTFNTTISPAITIDLASSVGFDAFGNIYFSGTADIPAAFSSMSDEFVVKLNSVGNQVWNRIYNNPSNTADHGVDLLIDNSGNTYNVGYTGRLFTSSINTTLIKYSSSGLMQWEGIFDSPGNQNDEAKQMMLDGGSSVYSLGTLTNEGTNVDVVLNKFNGTGNLLWQVTYDKDNGRDQAHSMLMDSQKHIYVLTNSDAGSNGTYVLVYDTLGTQLSAYYYPEYYNGMSMDASENIYLHGNGNGSYTDGECLARKIDLNGNTIYQSSAVSGNRSFYSSYSKANAAGELYVFSHALEDAPQRSYLHVAKLGTSGNLDWSFDIIGNDSTTHNNVNSVDMELDANGNVILLGEARSIGIPDMHTCILKVASDGTTIWRNDFTSGSGDSQPTDLKLDGFGTLWMGDFRTNLCKIDQQSGTVLNVSALGGPGFSFVENITRIAANEVLCTFTGFTNFHPASFLVKTDTSGNIIWREIYENINLNSAQLIDLKSDGNSRIYVLGNSAEGEGGYHDIILLKYCDLPIPSISSSGPYQNMCPGNPVTLTAGSGDSYLWNPSNTTQQTFITDTTAANYAFVYQSDGCYQSTDTLNITQRPAPTTPDICLVTVDSLSTHNIIYWDKTGLNLVDHFNIYREDVATFYNLIAVVPFDSLSEYHDYTSDPNVTTKRYKISSVDTCGVESPMSKYHNTIYVTSSGNGQYNWNLYLIEPSTNPVTNFHLMRDDSATGAWHQVGSTAGTQQTLNDPAYASFPNADWRIETSWGISCESTFRLSEQNSTQGVIVKSKSNIKNQRMIGFKQNYFSDDFLLFPDPASDQLNIALKENKKEQMTLEVVDELGRTQIKEVSNKTNISLDISQLSTGMYFLRITGNSSISTKKFIKQ